MAEHTVRKFNGEPAIAWVNMCSGEHPIDGLVGRCADSFGVLKNTKRKKAGIRH
jgi:hypothetical protein